MKAVLLFSFLALLNVSVAGEVTKINGAGATFPAPLYSKWFSDYQMKNKDVQINYQAIGSGGGIQQLLEQTVDFGASDTPMNEEQIKKAQWPVMHVPTVLGAVTIVVNGAPEGLKLDGDTLAKIFDGTIKKWDDAAILKLNSKLKLPSNEILVIHRADGSGTTAIFTEYLSVVSPTWKKNVGTGKTVNWPVGVGAKGNDGVTSMVQKTPMSIGYVELAYAESAKLSKVALKNKAGEFIIPSTDSISKAALKVDQKMNVIDQEGKGVYPISAFTFILIPENKKEGKLAMMRTFLKWALTEGQTSAAALYYAPLPKSLAKNFVNKL